MAPTDFPGGKLPGPHLYSLRLHFAPQKQRPGYATDDTSISYASMEINELFNEIKKGELDLVSSWMLQNKLSLNAGKSEFMLIGHPKQLNKTKDFPDLEVQDQKLCRAQKTKYLGVIIDESMNWEEQLKTVKRKIENGLGAIFKLKDILSQKQLATVYRALIESHLRYCSVIWGCLSNTELDCLQRLQNRARRLINNNNDDDNDNNNNNNNNNNSPGHDIKLHPVVEFRRGRMRLPFATTTSRSPLSKVPRNTGLASGGG